MPICWTQNVLDSGNTDCFFFFLVVWFVCFHWKNVFLVCCLGSRERNLLYISCGSLEIRKALKTWFKLRLSGLPVSAVVSWELGFRSSSLFIERSKASGQLGQLASCANSQVPGSGMQLAGSREVPGAQGNHESWSMEVPGWSQHPLPHQLRHGYCSVETARSSASAMNPETLCFYFQKCSMWLKWKYFVTYSLWRIFEKFWFRFI